MKRSFTVGWVLFDQVFLPQRFFFLLGGILGNHRIQPLIFNFAAEILVTLGWENPQLPQVQF